MQDVIPMLAYENGIAALEWLKQAFGFEEDIDMRMLDANGRLTHGTVEKTKPILEFSIIKRQAAQQAVSRITKVEAKSS